MASTIHWLHGSTPLDPGIVGGKAFGLRHLYDLGARVPDGFVVPAEAEPDSETVIEIENGLDRLSADGEGPVAFAIRSSAAAEDGVNESYAGMYATFLGVPRQNVLDAITACRSAADSPRLRAYRTDKTDAATVAVIVQRLLRPDVAGVCFTANPVSGSEFEMVIEVVEGGGEQLVSGAVTPECYRLNLQDGALVEFLPGDQGSRKGHLLSDADLSLLWRRFATIGAAFERPIDIEFALYAGVLYFLQARPVTTLRSLPKAG